MSGYGEGMDQEAMMESDMLVVVDENDVLVDGAVVSKKRAHEFNEEQPRGIAHRAFSIFIFNDKNEMLLTRRADSKITFPGVWTNTCCSHPLYGMTPNEVDQGPRDFPDFPGIKHAAIRKLRHELGIDPKYVPHDDIQFVSRFHYWAADTKTYGAEAPWGEHEVDYVLFLKNKEEQPLVHPNPDEVSEFKYVSIDDLKAMFEEPGLEWSPWFRGIMDLGGFEWWEDLEATLEGKHCYSDVTFFDPPQAHYGKYNLPSHDRLTGVLSSTEAKVKSH
jgi:isopentenyl-diphosphate delta-isomerase